MIPKSAVPAFRMPAEWEPHEGTWIAWPHNRLDWPTKFGPIPWVYAEIVRNLSLGENVHILVQNTKVIPEVQRSLKMVHANMDAVHLHVVPTNRVWVRDSGPTFVRDAKSGKSPLTLLDWRFNAWAKYRNWPKDDAVPSALSSITGLPRIEPVADSSGKRIVLEGGSIDVNGKGILLTTEECLLSKVQERNPGLNRSDYEAIFAQYLGIKKTIWLNRGIVGDDTHGHVDDLARFTDGNTVVVVSETDKTDDNYEPLAENFRILKKARNLRGEEFRVIKLPMPRPAFCDGQRLPASYANFYIANKSVLVPTFNDPADQVALQILQKLFPKRAVIGIYCRDLVWGLGTLHCLTQQQPATL